MNRLRVTLFGRLRIECGDRPIEPCEAQKAQELFCYLLLHRERPHPREALASLLWDHCSTAQSKAYLRKALWQLQQSFEVLPGSEAEPVLLVEPEWIQLNPTVDLWLDVDVLESTYQAIKGLEGWDLDEHMIEAIEQATHLYKGDLLENWYHDWCLYQRERLQHIYLVLLDKAMDYFELHGQYEAGQEYGQNILRIDRARENTHRRLMRLSYLAGDRTAALRQYRRCIEALREELDVGPAARTVRLYQLISEGQLQVMKVENIVETALAAGDVPPLVFEHLSRIRDLRHMLSSVNTQIGHELDAMELRLHKL